MGIARSCHVLARIEVGPKVVPGHRTFCCALNSDNVFRRNALFRAGNPVPKRPLTDTNEPSEPVLATGESDGALQGVSVRHEGEDTDLSVARNQNSESDDLLDDGYVARMALGKKIREAREALGMSQSELARRVGMRQQSIGSIEKGDVTRPGKLPEIARVLKRPLSYFLEDVQNDHPVETGLPLVNDKFPILTLTVVGDTAAGVWMEQDAWDTEKYAPIACVLTKYANLPHRAYHVSGSSMDAAGIPDGSFVVTVDYWAVRANLTDGDIVVVERRRGSLIERTCKAVSISGQEVEFVPRSTDPKHKPIAVPADGTEPDGTEIEVVGLVVNMTRAFG